jgi:hypothetical protein
MGIRKGDPLSGRIDAALNTLYSWPFLLLACSIELASTIQESKRGRQTCRLCPKVDITARGLSTSTTHIVISVEHMWSNLLHAYSRVETNTSSSSGFTYPISVLVELTIWRIRFIQANKDKFNHRPASTTVTSIKGIRHELMGDAIIPPLA